MLTASSDKFTEHFTEPGTILSSWPVLTHLILKITLENGYIRLLFSDEKKTEAEKKKQPAQGYSVTVPVEATGNPWSRTGFSQKLLPEPKFPTSHLQKGDSISSLATWLKNFLKKTQQIKLFHGT